MREITLASRVDNKEIIDYLYAHINGKIDFCKIIITTYVDNNFAYLLLACDDDNFLVFEKVLKDLIMDYIVGVYKVEYLKSKIKNPLSNTLAYNAYIKVLAVFDKTTDESALSKIINFNQTFYIDSFLEFRLPPLKSHWDNLATLSSDNISMLNSGTFLDVIRFLINTMDSLVYKIKVICNGEDFSVYKMKNKNANIKKVAVCHNSLDLISSVLNSCPSYIDVYIPEKSDSEAVSFLSNIFANRLKIYMKN